MLDSGFSQSFLRRDVFDNIKRLGLPHFVETAERRSLMVNGESCVSSEVIVLEIKIHSFSWKFNFLVLDKCPIPCILGVDFMIFAKVRIDFSTRRYNFLFQPEMDFSFESFDIAKCNSQEFPCFNDVLRSLLCGSLPDDSLHSAEITAFIRSFPALFSDKLGTVKGMVCHIDLSDTTESARDHSSVCPPRLQILREVVQDLVEKGVVKKSYCTPVPRFLFRSLVVGIG
jgi:predicted aspartyl protease